MVYSLQVNTWIYENFIWILHLYLEKIWGDPKIQSQASGTTTTRGRKPYITLLFNSKVLYEFRISFQIFLFCFHNPMIWEWYQLLMKFNLSIYDKWIYYLRNWRLIRSNAHASTRNRTSNILTKIVRYRTHEDYVTFNQL